MRLFFALVKRRVKIVTGTYETNFSKFAWKLFKSFQSFRPFTVLTSLSITNSNDHIDNGRNEIVMREILAK